MKIKYLFLTALCSFFLMACENNEPKPDSSNDSTGSEITDQISGYYDGIGTIVESTTLEDGSVVMKDENGNTITKDKDGNITIVTPDGEIILIDNSIKEDRSVPKDKWFHSTWGTNKNEPMPADQIEPIPGFIDYLQHLGFYVEQNNIIKDSTFVEQKSNSDYTIHFRYTTCYLQQIDTIVQYTYTRSINYLKITLYPGEVGEGEVRYALVIEGGHAVLYERYYYYNYDAGQYELEGETIASELDNRYLDENNAFLVYQGTETTGITLEVLSGFKQTTWFNYRRLSDTQLAANNNSASYLLKEIADDDRPIMKVYDIDGNYIKRLELISF